MRRGLIILILSFLVIPMVLGAMDPARGFCEHQDYIVDSGFCVFDDGNKCDMGEFYNGNCGQEFKKDFQCRDEGEIVFSQFEECCGSLKPSSLGMIAQGSCQPFSKRFVAGVKSNPLYWFVGLVILVFVVYIIFRIVRKKG